MNMDNNMELEKQFLVSKKLKTEIQESPNQSENKNTEYESQDEEFNIFDDLIDFRNENDVMSDNNNQQQTSIKKVLILYLGGSIGMQVNQDKIFQNKGYLQQMMLQNNYLCDQDFSSKFGQKDFLVTPIFHNNRRIAYKVNEMETIQSSADFDIISIIKIATYIESFYNDYDGFVLLTGVATLTYVASCLSFMFENLNKIMVMTASNCPIGIQRTDAFTNILNSLIIAGLYHIPEVLILNQDNIFRGNRSTSYDNNEFNLVNSPNFQPIGTLGVKIKIKWDEIQWVDKKKQFKVFKKLNKNILHIKLSPFFDCQFYCKKIQDSKIKGIILESYSGGRIPISDEKLFDMIETANQSGVVIVNISQSFKYNLKSNSDVGKIYQKYGIINGGDMTFEAVQAKLSYLLGKYKELDKVKQLININLRGEITTQSNDDIFSYKEDHFIQAIHDSISQKSSKNTEILKQVILPNIVCHVAKLGYIDFLKGLKQYGRVDFKKGDYYGRTALHIAAQEGNLDVVMFLLNEDCDYNRVDHFGKSPLYNAVINRHKPVIYQLKQKGAEVKGPKEEITSKLFQAVVTNDLEMIKIFFHSGLKNLNDFVNIENRNIAHIAVCEKKLEILKFLKDQVHFNFNMPDSKGRIPLNGANDDQDIINLLLL